MQWIDALEYCGLFNNSPRPQIDESSPAARAVWRIPAIDDPPWAENHDPDDGGGRGSTLSELRLLPASSAAPAGGSGSNDVNLSRWTKNTVNNISRMGSSTLMNRFGSAIRQGLHPFGNPAYKIAGPSLPARIPSVFSY